MRKFTFVTGLLIVMGFIGGSLMAQESNPGEFIYTSPRDGALYASPHHTIALRNGEIIDFSSVAESMIEVVGTESGNHTGVLVLSTDKTTLIFKPHQPFAYNEEVTVTIQGGILTATGVEMAPKSFSFRTMQADNTPLRDAFIDWYSSEQKKQLQFDESSTMRKASAGYKSTLELPEDYPPYFVEVMNNPTPGYMYVNPHNVFHPINLPGYSIVMDHYGTPVYYKRFDTHSLDYNLQETGEISQFLATEAGGLGIGYGSFFTYDENMVEIREYQMGNGYLAEMHDFQLFNDGSYLLFTYDPQIVDMSVIVEGGDPAATVMGFVLQELDSDDNVVFEWSSWDHFSITDAAVDVDLTKAFIDYCHGNSVERDTDGNILVSFRNTDEFVKINRTTGELMWRWNSHREDLNDITFVNDEFGFSHQHDLRRLENGNVTCFDNGNLHGPPPHTRILEYELDEVNMTAEPVFVYPPEPVPGSYFAFATGSTQKLDNGSYHIGWGVGFGRLPMVGELTADGETTYACFGIDTTSTYRSRKLDWAPTMFSLSKDTIDWGQFTGYTPEPYILQVTNNSLVESFDISGVHNHLQEFYVTTSMPVTVEPGATENITINFFPAVEGYFQDVLTVMVHKGEYEMIGKQVVMEGSTNDESAPQASFDPVDGTENMIRMPKLTLTLDEKLYDSNGEMISGDDLQDIVYLKTNGGEEVAANAHILWYDNSMTKIMIQPFDYLEANTMYEWGVSSNTVQDWAGNVIGEGMHAFFTTGEEMGVDDIVAEDFARIYPNPTQGNINLEFTNTDEKSVMIYDIRGNEVFRMDRLTGKAYYFNISDQPEGMYIVRVINQENNASVELKVIKE